MSESKLIAVQKVGKVTIAEFTERCTLIEDALLEDLNDQLLIVAQAADPPWVVLDLSHTQFFGSGFIEVLLRVWRELQKRPECKLILCGLQTYCKEVLQITHLDRLWPLTPTRDEALALL